MDPCTVWLIRDDSFRYGAQPLGPVACQRRWNLVAVAQVACGLAAPHGLWRLVRELVKHPCRGDHVHAPMLLRRRIGFFQRSF
jgi:hypothetical protein